MRQRGTVLGSDDNRPLSFRTLDEIEDFLRLELETALQQRQDIDLKFWRIAGDVLALDQDVTQAAADQCMTRRDHLFALRRLNNFLTSGYYPTTFVLELPGHRKEQASSSGERSQSVTFFKIENILKGNVEQVLQAYEEAQRDLKAAVAEISSILPPPVGTGKVAMARRAFARAAVKYAEVLMEFHEFVAKGIVPDRLQGIGKSTISGA
jgi:hypothetical protein